MTPQKCRVSPVPVRTTHATGATRHGAGSICLVSGSSQCTHRIPATIRQRSHWTILILIVHPLAPPVLGHWRRCSGLGIEPGTPITRPGGGAFTPPVRQGFFCSVGSDKTFRPKPSFHRSRVLTWRSSFQTCLFSTKILCVKTFEANTPTPKYPPSGTTRFRPILLVRVLREGVRVRARRRAMAPGRP